MRVRCKLGLHKNKDIGTQRTRHVCYGWANLPGVRVVKQCEFCDNISYQSLNLATPYKDLINNRLWKRFIKY
jgi:hypothetical protein